ncbi:hypothetical protein BJ742DRAFT_771661 [Cladochytrium replicatum]|nr:hypothetical protein BJ742DRAFT_771661 [Cladochytrium replicatum]
MLDKFFFTFLAKTCGPLNATTISGEKCIEFNHQTLVAKKANRLNHSFNYSAAKFRIQSFTTGFLEGLQDTGYSEETFKERQVKAYLWQQRYIQRFNEDGRKAKSKELTCGSLKGDEHKMGAGYSKKQNGRFAASQTRGLWFARSSLMSQRFSIRFSEHRKQFSILPLFQNGSIGIGTS